MSKNSDCLVTVQLFTTADVTDISSRKFSLSDRGQATRIIFVFFQSFFILLQHGPIRLTGIKKVQVGPVKYCHIVSSWAAHLAPTLAIFGSYKQSLYICTMDNSLFEYSFDFQRHKIIRQRLKIV